MCSSLQLWVKGFGGWLCESRATLSPNRQVPHSESEGGAGSVGSLYSWLLLVLDAHLEGGSDFILWVEPRWLKYTHCSWSLHGVRFYAHQQYKGRKEGRGVHVHAHTCVHMPVCMCTCMCACTGGGEYGMVQLKAQNWNPKFQSHFYFHLFPFREPRKKIKYW